MHSAIGLGLENIEYEPEQFPGLIYRLGDSDIVVLLFSTGKMVTVGGTVPEEAEAAVETIHSRLTVFSDDLRPDSTGLGRRREICLEDSNASVSLTEKRYWRSRIAEGGRAITLRSSDVGRANESDP
jgi:hypothetical protein